MRFKPIILLFFALTLGAFPIAAFGKSHPVVNCGGDIGCLSRRAALCLPTSGAQRFTRPVKAVDGLQVWSRMDYRILGRADEQCRLTYTEETNNTVTESFKANLVGKGAGPVQVAEQVKLVPRKTTSTFRCAVEDAKALPTFFKKWRAGGYVEFMAYCDLKQDAAGNFSGSRAECHYGTVTCETGK